MNSWKINIILNIMHAIFQFFNMFNKKIMLYAYYLNHYDFQRETSEDIFFVGVIHLYSFSMWLFLVGFKYW